MLDTSGVLGSVQHGDPKKTYKVKAIKWRNGRLHHWLLRSQAVACDGKPSEALLHLLKSGCGIDPTMLMVGDTIQTDIVFGNRGGMATLLHRRLDAGEAEMVEAKESRATSPCSQLMLSSAKDREREKSGRNGSWNASRRC